jgi:diguanylate cyclase (GGDEF)-like protein
MIDSFDIRTLAFVASTVFMAMTLILTLVYLTRRVYPGFGHWVLWQACLTAGSLEFAFRTPETPPHMLVLTSSVMLLSSALLFDGLSRFYGLYASRWPATANYAVVVVGIAGQFWFTFGVPDLDARILIYAVVQAALMARCSLEPLRLPGPRRSLAFWLMAGVLLLLAVNNLHHIWQVAQPGLAVDPLRSDQIRLALIVAVVGNILGAYGLLLQTGERLEEELDNARRDIETVARTDSLTGLWNRRHFEDMAEAEVARAQRYATPLALLAFDADHFKRVNDEFGHHAGDVVLQEIARLVGTRIRRSDILCRWGGEEFMVLAPGTARHAAADMADKIRQEVAGHSFPAIGRVTISVGVGQIEPGESAESWMRRVDAALYEAKQRGRNRVISADAIATAAL